MKTETDLNELEVSLKQDDSSLNFYLEITPIATIRLHIQQMLEKRENPDRQKLKQKIKDAIDAA